MAAVRRQTAGSGVPLQTGNGAGTGGSSCALLHPPGLALDSKQEIHRRSARLRNTKYKSAPAAEKKVSTKGKGRRHIFKLKNVRRCVAPAAGLGTPRALPSRLLSLYPL
uniref:Uncharacterized protein n=1 Tax=Bubo bubo TaxID=30461 RepID=A0A8C0IHH2_BUBBB